MKEVILVDRNDNEIGVCEKIKAHKDGKLHRAFSVFTFNSKEELLIQRRAKEKYHSGGLWTNTVCSHPKPRENLEKGIKQRMIEEMGFSTEVEKIFSFLYKSDYENGLTEHEYDHVFISYYDNTPEPNPEEVMDYDWVKIDDIKKDIKNNPEKYTTWFKIILENEEFLKKIRERERESKSHLKNKIINIIGQVRIYSLIDLALFGFAIGSNYYELAGIILLHLSFLFYLEYTHKHHYRLSIPKYIWIILGVLGIIFYQNWFVIGYILASIFYVRKNQKNVSPWAPASRGFQYYFIAAGILGWFHWVAILSFFLLFWRNFAGDLRDIVKDRKEKMNTLPIVLELKKDWKKIHLISTFGTSFVWVYLLNINFLWLLPIFLIQYLTYNITTR